MLVTITSISPLHGMKPQREQLYPITLPYIYCQLSERLLPDIARYIFSLQLKASNVELTNLPFQIKESCKDPENLVQCINKLIESCGYNLARTLFNQFFPYGRSICDIKAKNKKRSPKDLSYNAQGHYEDIVLHYGDTALHYAARCDNTAALKFLLDIAGENRWSLLIMKNLCCPHSGYGGGQTALHCAARKSHVEIVKLLLDAAGNNVYSLLKVKDYFDDTALHNAASNRNIEIVKLLLDAAGDKVEDYIAMKSHHGYGSTALHLGGQKIEEVIKPYLQYQSCLVFYPDCSLF